MHKLVQDLLSLLREMLANQQRLLQIAAARLEAMRLFEVEKLHELCERERDETFRVQQLNQRRALLISQFRGLLGPAEPTVSEIAKHCGEPEKTQLLCLASEMRTVVEKLDRTTRINAKVSDGVVNGISKVLKIMTGMVQHAGLYMRNGRKAALRGIHLLEVTA